MMHTVHVVQAFAEGQSLGSKLAVVAQAEQLEATARQQIAVVMGLPETTFVSRRQHDQWELQSYSADGERPSRQSTTLAALALMPQLGEAEQGWHRVHDQHGVSDLLLEQDAAFRNLPPAKYAHVLRDSVTLLQVQHALELPAEVWRKTPLPCRVDCGSAYLIVPLPDELSLQTIIADEAIIASLCQRLELAGLCAFVMPQQGSDTIASRVFEPGADDAGISASEVAAAAVACYAREHLACPNLHYQIDQGDRESAVSRFRLSVTLTTDAARILRVRVGGQVRIWRTFQFET